MQIFFHGIFGRHASIFVLWEVKEPKECLSGHKQGRKSFLQDAGFHHRRVLGRVSSGRTLHTPLPPTEALMANEHLLFVQQNL